jgi:hypothetical protein
LAGKPFKTREKEETLTNTFKWWEETLEGSSSPILSSPRSSNSTQVVGRNPWAFLANGVLSHLT